MEHFFNSWIKFFFVLAPFFVLSMFLSLTAGYSSKARNKKALVVILTVQLACTLLYFFGDVIFKGVGITVDSFRVGAGILLFLSAVDLVRASKKAGMEDLQETEIAVVPLSIPITVGPAVIGTLFVMGADSVNYTEKIMGFGGVTAAIACLGVILYCATFIEKVLGRQGIEIMSKISGLFLAALASQLVLEGIKNILHS